MLSKIGELLVGQRAIDRHYREGETYRITGAARGTDNLTAIGIVYESDGHRKTIQFKIFLTTYPCP